MKNRKIKVLYDHQVFSLQNYGGITAYHENLLLRLKKYDVKSTVALLVSSNYQISKIKKHLYLPFNGSFVKLYLRYFYFFINSFYTFIVFTTSKFDIFHPTYYEPYFISFLGKKKMIITVHDCAYEAIGTNQRWSKRIIENKKLVILRADRILTVSEDAKKDIIKYYKVNPDKIKVVYLFSPLGTNRIKRDRYVKNRFVLYIGNREFNKNFTRFVEAYKNFNGKHNNIKLLCLGGGNFTDGEKKLLNKLGLVSLVEWKDIKTDSDAVKYLQKASMFVFPTLKEGFGIPLLNAFVCGCPVVASNIPVFNEIADGAFVPFNPKSVSDIVKAMDIALTDKELIKANVSVGYKYIKKYNADRMAKDISEVYKQVNNQYHLVI